MYEEITRQAEAVVTELLEQANLRAGSYGSVCQNPSEVYRRPPCSLSGVIGRENRNTVEVIYADSSCSCGAL